MKVKEITKDYILFDNNKYLTYKVTNTANSNDYYFDVFSLPKEFYTFEFNESKIQFIEFGIINMYLEEDENYNILSKIPPKNFQKIGLLIIDEIVMKQEYDYYGEKMQYPGTIRTKKEFFIPIYKNKHACSNESNTKVEVLYNNKTIATFDSTQLMELPGSYIHSEEIIHYDENKAFTIKNVTEDFIEFSNNKKLTYPNDNYWQINYADFNQIDDLATETVFYENEFVFNAFENYGFIFGNRGGNMVFVPCYSCQNGEYSASVDIYYDEKPVLHVHQAELK